MVTKYRFRLYDYSSWSFNIRPGHLNDGEGSGKIQIGDELGNKAMAREDVASIILASLEEDQTIGKAFDVINGDTSIEEALSTL